MTRSSYLAACSVIDGAHWDWLHGDTGEYANVREQWLFSSPEERAALDAEWAEFRASLYEGAMERYVATPTWEPEPLDADLGPRLARFLRGQQIIRQEQQAMDARRAVQLPCGTCGKR